MTDTTDFGRDLSCTTTLSTVRYVRGNRLVAEAMFRRVTTRRGLLRWGEAEANYGIDLTELLGSVTAERDLPALPGRIEAEITKDERVESVTVTINALRLGPDITVEITIEAVTADGPFDLVLEASAALVKILSFREGI